MDFIHQKVLTRYQPHRYLTAGLLHGSLWHLLLNMRYLSRIPRWVEDNGGSDGKGWCTGWPLYITTYLLSIIVGNRVHDYAAGGKVLSSISAGSGAAAAGLGRMCLGASGGICGLNGLRFGMLRRMENRIESKAVLKDMLVLGVIGALVDGVSNAAHVGGFICGLGVAMLCGPTYGYDAGGPKRTVIGDDVPIEYRRVMGGGKVPKRGMVPLRYFWAVLGLWGLVYHRFNLRSIPAAVWTGFREPGVLSGMVTSII